MNRITFEALDIRRLYFFDNLLKLTQMRLAHTLAVWMKNSRLSANGAAGFVLDSPKGYAEKPRYYFKPSYL